MGTVHTLPPNHGKGRSLPSGDGGGTYDGMESRVAVLENNVEHLKTDVSELRNDVRDIRDRLARVEEVIRALPGT